MVDQRVQQKRRLTELPGKKILNIHITIADDMNFQLFY